MDPSGHASEEQFDNDGDTNDWLDKATEGGFGQIVTSDVALNTGLETYYRTMSPSDYDYLVMTGEIPATAETFISPSQSYANNYNGTTVKFKVDAGTTNELLNIGVSNNSGQVIQDYGVLPQVSSG